MQLGEYIDFSNSLHVYGKDIKEVRELLSSLRDRPG